MTAVVNSGPRAWKFHVSPAQGFRCLAELIRRVIEIAGPTGTITFDQLNDLCPSHQAEPEDIEVLLSALNAEGIQIVEE
jgi:hypothetical protein